MIWTDSLPYFPRHELACKGTGVICLDIRFAVALPALRQKWTQPLTPTSVCRTPEHNRAINDGKGGHPNSLHLTKNPKWPTSGTMAADIAWRTWADERKLAFAKLAYHMGWSVGLNDGFCHIDRRGDLALINLPQAVFVYGGQWSGRFNPHDVMEW